MTSAVFLVILCLGIMSGSSAHDPSLDAEWEEWKMEYERSYSLVGNLEIVQKGPRVQEEEAMRRTVWEKNMKIIKDHNGENGLGKNGYTMGMNDFGDMVSVTWIASHCVPLSALHGVFYFTIIYIIFFKTDEEFKDMMIDIPIQPHNNRKGIWKRAVGGGGLPTFVDWRKDLPKFVDWQKKGYVTSVQNQGKCGACWAFAVTGAIEGQMFKKTGKLTPLSVQNLVDCSKPHGNNGCASGTTYNAFQYVLHNGGVEAEATYPYERKEGPCRYDPKNSAAKIKLFVALPMSEDILMDAVATKGPIVAGMHAVNSSFLFYKTGIYHEPKCSSYIINHAVLVVGYGVEGNEMHGESYWMIKNSWGKKWGLRGYMKLAKDWNNHCAIASYAQYPIPTNREDFCRQSFHKNPPSDPAIYKTHALFQYPSPCDSRVSLDQDTLSDTSSQTPKLRKMDNSKATEDNPPSQDILATSEPPSLPPRTLMPT
ncbi:hypothetical protein A6R68_24060, partial [Neotoma lepida]